MPHEADDQTGVSYWALARHEHGEEQENMTEEQNDNQQKEFKEEEEDDILDINLNDDELFADSMYEEELSATQVDLLKKIQSNILEKQNDGAMRPIQTSLEQPQSSLSTRAKTMSSEVLAHRQQESQNASTFQRLLVPNSIPTAPVVAVMCLALVKAPS